MQTHSKLIHVLMTADPIGGVWMYAMELAHALQPRGVKFTIATMGARLTAEQTAEARGLPNVEICESSFKLEWMDSPWADVEHAGDWLLQLAGERHPDVIHLNGYAHGALNWPAPVLVVAHSCVLSWWHSVKGESPPEQWSAYRDAVTRGIRAADHIVAPSHTMLKAVRHFYGPLPEADVIYNARSPALYKPGPKKKFVLAIGRGWDEAKNIAALANVATGLPWPIYLAGETRSPDGNVLATEGLKSLGRLNSGELAPWLAQASIYALPAFYEPFGLSVLEAALAGCALVLGDIPSLREIWGDAALFVPPHDQSALREALHRLMHAEDAREEMAARARRRATIFNPQCMGGAYLDLYKRLANRARNQKYEREPAICA